MIVELKELSKSFGNTKALDGVSFSFASGEVVGFIGPNGAGKTTTMRIMATLEEPTSGDVLIDGVSIIDYPEEAHRLLGFMPDSLPDYGDLTAHEYLDFFGRAYGFRGATLSSKLNEVEEFTGVSTISEKRLNALSKGMKQRVSLARAMIHDPALIVMDEPANGLDPRARIELRDLIKKLAGMGKALLVSSHILTELSEMISSYQIIERGGMLQGGVLSEGDDLEKIFMTVTKGDLA